MNRNRNRLVLIVTSLLCLAPLIPAALLWDRLPEQMVLNWDFSGAPTGTSSRLMAVVFLPLTMLAGNLAVHLFVNNDPKRANASSMLVGLGKWLLPVLSIGMSTFVFGEALGRPMHLDRVMPMLLGLLFIVLGNYLPKCKQNYTVGIKLPWTLQDEDNWNRTHRMAGFVWVLGGVVMLPLALLQHAMFLVPGVVLIMVLVPAVYSFRLYRQGQR